MNMNMNLNNNGADTQMANGVNQNSIVAKINGNEGTKRHNLAIRLL